MTTAHLFLSDDWIAAARDLRAELEEQHADEIPPPPVTVKINVVVTDIPHRDDLHGHIDSSAGTLVIEEAHLDDAELTLTVDYETTFAAFVTRDPQALMQAFLGGKILIEGDASQLMMLMGQAPPTGSDADQAKDVYERIAAFTITEE